LSLTVFLKPTGTDEEPNDGDDIFESLQTELRDSIELSSGKLAEIHSLDVADLDNNGRNEIVASGWFANQSTGAYDGDIRVWTYDAASNTSTLEATQPWFGSGATLSSTVISDVDNDGTGEIIVAGHYQPYFPFSKMSIWNYSSGRLNKEAESGTIGSVLLKSISISDVDNDGDTEIVTTGYIESSQYRRGYLAAWSYLENGGPLARDASRIWTDDDNTRLLSLATGDIDCDGDSEIIVGGRGWDDTNQTETSKVVVFNLSEDGEFSVEHLLTWPGLGAKVIFLYRIDSDENSELIVGDARPPTSGRAEYLSVWKYSAEGKNLTLFGEGKWWVSGRVHLAQISRICLSDMCGDYIFTAGYLDKLGIYSSFLQIWEFNLSGGKMNVVEQNHWRHGSSTIVNSAILADIDSDGRLELITGGATNGTRTYQIRIWEI
jgi:hypothetical protein